MSHIFQFLRGTAAEWAAHDVPLKDGEIALLKKGDGRVEMRIGNGSGVFSELPPVGESKVDIESPPFGELITGHDYRLGSVDAVELYFPETPTDDFYALLTFDSGEEAAIYYTDEDCRFTGEDTENGVFTPVANKHYTVLLWYDGTKQGLVRGVANG